MMQPLRLTGAPDRALGQVGLDPVIHEGRFPVLPCSQDYDPSTLRSPKARKAIAVPLNPEAVVVIRKQIGRHPTHVFSFKGKPIRQVSTKAWYGALKRAEIEDFRWHDLQHTWASWHVQNGTPLHALHELGGWESAEMVRRYAHLSAEHLAPYADRLDALRVVEHPADGTNLAQAPNEQGLQDASP